MEHDCHYDNLTIFNGYGINHPVLGRYCSRRGDITLESSSNEMTVLFISDALTNGRGFSAKYDTISGGENLFLTLLKNTMLFSFLHNFAEGFLKVPAAE